MRGRLTFAGLVAVIALVASAPSASLANSDNGNNGKGKSTSTTVARGKSADSAGQGKSAPTTTEPVANTSSDNSAKGNAGNANDNGAKGNAGNANDNGAKGNSGNANDNGAKGNSGNANDNGAKGNSGNANDNGAKGNSGNANDNSAKGNSANDKARDKNPGNDKANGRSAAARGNTTETANDAKVRYVLRFREGVDPAATAGNIAKANKGNVNRTFSKVFNGATISVPAKAINGIKRNPNVLAVEEDFVVKLDPASVVQQLNPTWGLDRVDQRALPLNASFGAPSAASSTRVYVIDTGVLGSHGDFGGRVVNGFDALASGNGWNDCNGHGTHVAGTVGGSTYGVAKLTTIVPVRVLDCAGSGTLSGVIAGLDWVAGQHVSGQLAVANMSLGGGASSTLDSAVNNLINRGVAVVVAAGNSAADACNYSPARVPAAITVAATTSTDARASYSNFGTCVDVFAPGSSVTSAWYTSTTATATLSGTSMASPHVAGIAAVALAVNGAQSPSQLATAIVESATPDAVVSAGTGSPNLLAYVFVGGDGGDDATAPAQPSAPNVTAQRRAIALSWSLPDDGGSPITSQIVRVYEGSRLVKSATVSGSTTAGRVSGLKAGKSYTATVTAVNSVGSSPESNRSNEVTALR
jgi:subtilisin family serine protease